MLRLRACALLVTIAVVGCGSDDPSPASTDAGPKSCEEGGVVHASGTTWTCADRCNSCGCQDGVVSQTKRACVDASPPKPCFADGEARYSGETWPCSDGCNTCSCHDGVVGSTLMECVDAGPDAGADSEDAPTETNADADAAGD